MEGWGKKCKRTCTFAKLSIFVVNLSNLKFCPNTSIEYRIFGICSFMLTLFNSCDLHVFVGVKFGLTYLLSVKGKTS